MVNSVNFDKTATKRQPLFVSISLCGKIYHNSAYYLTVLFGEFQILFSQTQSDVVAPQKKNNNNILVCK